MDVPEICRVLFWICFSAAFGAYLLEQPETYLERMVLSTSFKRKTPDASEQDTRGMTKQLLGPHEREWFSQDGSFDVPWQIIATQVPRRVAFVLHVCLPRPVHD
jgi:hypothetical protein